MVRDNACFVFEASNLALIFTHSFIKTIHLGKQMHKNGDILSVVFTSASVSDREADGVTLLCSSVNGGRAIGDLGYRGQSLRTALKEVGMGLLTPATGPKRLKLYLSKKRERIETAFSSLWDTFIDRVKSRSCSKSCSIISGRQKSLPEFQPDTEVQ